MRDALVARINAWVDDPESDVEYAEEVEGRWAVRIRQNARDATTVWFDTGQRSLSYEAYFFPVPDGSTETYRQALRRNGRGWRAFFALDDDGGLILRGRMAAERVDADELDLLLGEIYEMVEIAFRPLVRSAYQPAKNAPRNL